MTYKTIKCPVEFIGMANSNGAVLEHRLVAAKKYGRLILSTENVHHIDSDTLNNHPDNLIVLTKSAHHKLPRKRTDSILNAIVYPVKFNEADYLDLKQNALDNKVTVAEIIRRLVKKYLTIVRRSK